MTQKEELKLTAEEKEAIEQLRSKMPENMDRELYNDTYYFHLILKDQRYDVDKAEIIMKKILQWREKMQLDKIESFKPPEVIKNYFEKHMIGYDKQGSIIHYMPLGKIDPKGVTMSAKFADLEKTCIQVIEEDVKTLRSKREFPCGPHPRTIHIYDMEGLSFANATDKKGIEYMIRILKTFEDYYPWILSAVYIINVSSYFMIPLSIVKSCISPEKLSLAHFFGADGYKEELRKIIDPDVLPAFLGGNRTDPDGNPLCKTLVIQGGKIDEKHYVHKSKNPLTNAPGAKKLILARASFSEIEIEIEEDGSLIEWEFETKTRDIGFGLFYKSTVDGEEQITELVPLVRIDTEDYAETGVYKCEKAGTYIMLFDNSYSWIRSKEIYYRTKIVSSKQHQEEMQN